MLVFLITQENSWIWVLLDRVRAQARVADQRGCGARVRKTLAPTLDKMLVFLTNIEE